MTSKRWRQTLDDWHLWLDLTGFEREVPFKGLSGKRRWRMDWQHHAQPIAIEYQGKGVGHQSYNAVERDYEKCNEAQLCGLTVILCSAKSVEDGRCVGWIEDALAKRKETGP